MRVLSGRPPAGVIVVCLVVGAVVGGGWAVGLGPWLAVAVAGAAVGVATTRLAARATGGSRRSEVPLLRDPVSDLPTAAALESDFRAVLTAPEAFGAAVYVCVLHGLGEYNDAYGEPCGDAMIAWLGRRLRDTAADARVYRMRGANFAVLSSLADGAADLSAAYSRALLEVGEGFMIRGAVGRALAPEEATTPAAAVELATRRALSARGARPGDGELRPPQDPLEVMPLVRPRHEVADVAARIGRRMGLLPAELEDLAAAAHLRDVGNMALPAAVLARQGELPAHEWEFIRLHTLVGERLLAANFGMESVARLVRCSHERWDGGGYPDGLAGTAIPLGARILFVCTAFQDMTSERAHRPAREAGDALLELALRAGSQFDPDVVAAFEEEFAPAPGDAQVDFGRRGRRQLSVLVADDDAASRFLLARAIDAAGLQCTTVADGMSAWRTFRQRRPDIVICDSRLPKMGADRLCRRIRLEEADRQTYFVTLVAAATDEPVDRSDATGFDDFLAKPFDRGDLQALLAAAVRESTLRRDQP